MVHSQCFSHGSKFARQIDIFIMLVTFFFSSVIFSLLFFFKEWPLFVLQFVGLVKVTRLVGDEMFFCASPAFG